jgi:hypothetical protein
MGGWMKGRLRKVAGASGLVAFLLAMAAPASGLIANEPIVAVSESSFGTGSGVDGAFVQAARIKARLQNDDSDAKHNVVSTAEGPDGGPLFASPLVDPGETDDVEGTQYLEAGTYHFVCTIHSGMSGDIEVQGSGAMPRPDIRVAIASKRLRNLKKGKLAVKVAAATVSDDVSVSAFVGGKPAGFAEDIDLAPAERRTVKLKLGKQARKAVKKGLKKKRKVAVSVSAAVPFGAPDSVKKKLK